MINGKGSWNIVKLGSPKLERFFQVLIFIPITVKLKSCFQHTTFQFHNLSNYPFQLHVDYFKRYEWSWKRHVCSWEVWLETPSSWKVLNREVFSSCCLTIAGLESRQLSNYTHVKRLMNLNCLGVYFCYCNCCWSNDYYTPLV